MSIRDVRSRSLSPEETVDRMFRRASLTNSINETSGTSVAIANVENTSNPPRSLLRLGMSSKNDDSELDFIEDDELSDAQSEVDLDDGSGKSIVEKECSLTSFYSIDDCLVVEVENEDEELSLKSRSSQKSFSTSQNSIVSKVLSAGSRELAQRRRVELLPMAFKKACYNNCLKQVVITAVVTCGVLVIVLGTFTTWRNIRRAD